MKKALSIIGKSLIIAFAAWFLISWCDIMADNTAPNPQHLQWNMFTVMFPEAGKQIAETQVQRANNLEKSSLYLRFVNRRSRRKLQHTKVLKQKSIKNFVQNDEKFFPEKC